jgi:hypothetical protein
MLLVGNPQGFPTIGSLTDNGHACLFQEGMQSLADHDMIFGQENPDRHRGSP